MEQLQTKLVIRMKDGTMIKCGTYSHFSAAFQKLKVVTASGKVESVNLDDVKAIFFVKEFEGNTEYHEKKRFTKTSPRAGKSVSVKFDDGETLNGKVISLPEVGRGFFLYPADPNSNNLKIFIVRSATKEIKIT